ncbi:hypothetical protein Psi02_43000 [Planotetraspora silvatica]|uniref:OmpR/PhoB-type domain-containing protein n=1 Tax=Planotetraspora silvatica TaxID=234614 RepID=A0A8J3UP13_9ACTN|nr:winged helix-turn-helix domain-containing protein [Planotetraspora silvatica]GII47876.1 hypothetical protein Psi02_43000 [Planotetraspora silvatica]
MSHVIDFVARRREPGYDPSPPDEGTVLSVLPMPGVDAALVIVGYVVPLDGGSRSARGLRLPQGVTLPEGGAARAQDVKWPHGIALVQEAELPEGLAAFQGAATGAAEVHEGSEASGADRPARPAREAGAAPGLVAHPDRAGHASRHGRTSAPVEELVVDRASRAVRVDGVEIDLTYREFELLDYLCSAPGRVFNRRQLMAAIWDRYGDEGARTVDVHVLRLRRKLGPHAGRIVTVRNVGYKYQPPRS